MLSQPTFRLALPGIVAVLLFGPVLAARAQDASIVPQPSGSFLLPWWGTKPPTDTEHTCVDLATDADQAPPWFTCLDIGAKSWISWGHSESNIRVGAVDVGSRLTWHNVVAETGEVGASGVFFDRLIVNGLVGAGNVSTSRLIDDDFILFRGQQVLFTEGISPGLNDNIHYAIGQIGWRVCGGMSLLIGYQYWREKYVDEGGAQVTSLPGFPIIETLLPPGRVIAEQFTWQGPTIGFQTGFDICEGLAFRAKVMFMPVTWFQNDDDHFLRQLTVTEKATGGFGVMADIGFSYNLCRGLYLVTGYRIWDLHSASGRTEEELASGSGEFTNGSRFATVPLNGAQTIRQGLTLGLTYEF